MRLGVNVDHVATVRQARRTDEPDPVRAAVLAEIPSEKVHRLYRTVAVERLPAPAAASPVPAPPAPPMSRWVLAKHHVRAAARRLSPRFEAWLHSFYVGRLRGRARKQGVL